MRRNRRRSESGGDSFTSLRSLGFEQQVTIGVTIKYPNGDRYEGQFIEIPDHSASPGVISSSNNGNSRTRSSPRLSKRKGKSSDSTSSSSLPSSASVGMRRIKHGVGSYFFSNGDKYCGDWEAGRMHGEGCFHWAEGDVYTGHWERGAISGMGTKHCASDNTVSQGYWRGGGLHGQGKRAYGCGDTYAGEHWEDRRHGFGRYTWNNSSYSTALVFGKTVLLTHRSGDVYVGEWKEDCCHGVGQLCRESCPQLTDTMVGPMPGCWDIKAETCMVYSGDMVSGVAHGHGTGLFEYADDNSTAEDSSLLVEYTGEWRFGCRHGYGECNYVFGAAGLNSTSNKSGSSSCSSNSSASNDDAVTIMKYCGQFEGGRRHGQGTLTQRLVVRTTTDDIDGVGGNSGIVVDPDAGGSIWSNEAAPVSLFPPAGPATMIEVIEAQGENNGTEHNNNDGDGDAGAVDNVEEDDDHVREVFYQGDWKDNNKDGFGIQVDELGGVYRGAFKNGLRHGQGEYSRCIITLPLEWDRLHRQLIPLLGVTATYCGSEPTGNSQQQLLGTNICGRWENGVYVE